MSSPFPDSGAVGGTVSSGTTIADTLSLVGTNRVIIATFGLTTDDRTHTSATTITGISDTSSLTWTLHKRTTWSYTLSGQTTHNTIEVWWAPSAAQVTTTISATMSQTATNCGFVYRGFGGCHDITAPFDSNAAVPATATDTSGSLTVPTNTITTSEADDLIHQLAVFHGNTGGSAGSGFTQLDTIALSNTVFNDGILPAQFYTQYKSVSATQSSASEVMGASFKDWSIIAFVLTGDATSLSGTWASTEPPDTMAFTGFPGFPGERGDWQSVEAPDTFTAVGYLSALVTLNATENPDVFSAFVFQPLTGTWNSTERPDTFSAIGVGRGEDGTWTSNEAPDVFAAFGSTPITGSLHATESADVFVALGVGVTGVRRRRRIFFAT